MHKRAMQCRILLLATLVIGLGAQAQTLSAADKEKALKYLQSTEQGVTDATKGLTTEQWNFKAGPDRWSIAQCVEHIAAAEDLLYGMITNQVMKAPARTKPEDLVVLDEMVLTRIPDRSHKAQAPEPLKPTNRFGTPDAALKHFDDSRAQTIVFLEKAPDLRAHATDSPLGKQLDAYEWVLFIAAHSDRHTKQILEVKADPNFPKGTAAAGF
jgi:DinB superfamily